MADHPHTGHRKRMMEKFRRFGMDIFADHEVLEILLFFAMRQGDTNPTAHRLLERFGSLHAVLEAPAEQLEEVAGVGPHTADLIKTVYAMIGRYRADVSKSERYSDRLNTYERVGEYFAPQLAHERDEVLLAAYLDGEGLPAAVMRTWRWTRIRSRAAHCSAMRQAWPSRTTIRPAPRARRKRIFWSPTSCDRRWPGWIWN